MYYVGLITIVRSSGTLITRISVTALIKILPLKCGCYSRAAGMVLKLTELTSFNFDYIKAAARCSAYLSKYDNLQQ